MRVHPFDSSIGVKPNYALAEKGREVGQALNVIPMKVREQNIFAEAGIFRLIEDLPAKLPDASARIEHNAPAFRLNCNARGLATEAQVRALRRGNAATHSPEGSFHDSLSRNPI